MRKQQLSPSASVFMSLALALGILVADLSNTYTLTSASAQSLDGESAVPVADAEIVSDEINVIDVVVNGVVTRGVILGSVKVIDSVMLYDGSTANGVNIGDNLTGVNIGDNLTGVNIGDNNSLTGVNIGDNNTNSVTGVNIGDNLTGVNIGDNRTAVSGGTLYGTDVQVVDGVISGGDLTIVGTVVRANFKNIVIRSGDDRLPLP